MQRGQKWPLLQKNIVQQSCIMKDSALFEVRAIGLVIYFFDGRSVGEMSSCSLNLCGGYYGDKFVLRLMT